MKFIFVFRIFSAFLLISTTVFAEDPNDCSKRIFELNEWNISTEQQVACLNQNPAYEVGTAELCLADKSDISDIYKKYLKFEKDHDEAWHIYSTTQDDVVRRSAEAEMMKIEMDWSRFGYRQEVFGFLSLIDIARITCKEN